MGIFSRLLVSLMLVVYTRAIPLDQQLDQKSVRVINGEAVTNKSQYPFMIDLAYNPRDISSSRFCTGTLIRKNVILTAAHCVLDEGAIRTTRPIRAAVGRIHLDNDHERNEGSQVFRAVVAQVYEKYTGLGSDGDVAVMLLDGASTAPTVNLSQVTPGLDTELVVVGYGIDEIGTLEGTGSHVEIMPKELRQTKLRVKEPQFCDVPEIDLRTVDGMICTVGAKLGASACHGDSGGPLFQKMEDYVVQVGVVSYGDAECHSSDAGVFTSVSVMLEWINKSADRLQALAKTSRIVKKVNAVRTLIDQSMMVGSIQSEIHEDFRQDGIRLYFLS